LLRDSWRSSEEKLAVAFLAGELAKLENKVWPGHLIHPITALSPTNPNRRAPIWHSQKRAIQNFSVYRVILRLNHSPYIRHAYVSTPSAHYCRFHQFDG